MSRTVMFASDTACFSTILSVTSLIGIFNTLRNLPLQQKKNRDIIFRWLVRPQVSILSTKFIFQSQPMFPFSKDWCDFNVNLVWYITCKNYLIEPFKLDFFFLLNNVLHLKERFTHFCILLRTCKSNNFKDTVFLNNKGKWQRECRTEYIEPN